MATKNLNSNLTDICRIIDDTVDTEQIYLFGSYAYGSPSAESDYDLCVVIPDDSLRPVDAAKRIRRALCPTQAMPLDVIVYRASSFRERQKMASLERKIAREGVLLHERERKQQRMV